MSIHNTDIADAFEQLANLLEIEGANRFRVRAYRNAARTVRQCETGMADLLKAGRHLDELPTIGKDLAGKIQTLVETGRLPLLEEVQSHLPPGLVDLLRVEGLGPRRVKALHEQLHIRNVDELKRAADEGRIRMIDGFGAKTEAMIKQHLEHFSPQATRVKLLRAQALAVPLLAWLRACTGIEHCEVAGSYRRCRETVGDLDILATARESAAVTAHFVRYSDVAEVISHGDTRASVRLRAGMQVDLRAVPPESYGAALLYFTGSRAHNIALRQLAIKQGYKINEYGLYQNENRIAGSTEQAMYQCLGLAYIEPELRENRGELEAAARHALPSLVSLPDIVGDLHCHTNASDGFHTLEQMAAAAMARHYQYLSINDHSPHLAISHGLDQARLLAQIGQIDRFNQTLAGSPDSNGFTVLKSAEVDILEDGRLDLPDSVLGQLDFTVCAIHSRFNLSREQQTARILRAMDNPHFTILAHPTGRLINQRQPCLLDMEKIMRHALECGCFLEINAQPDRLDLDDEACKMARDMGLKLAISSDAHDLADLENMRFGLNQARRGWLEARDVINCLPLAQLKKLLRRA